MKRGAGEETKIGLFSLRANPRSPWFFSKSVVAGPQRARRSRRRMITRKVPAATGFGSGIRFSTGANPNAHRNLKLTLSLSL